jgi:hypothetical protein
MSPSCLASALRIVSAAAMTCCRCSASCKACQRMNGECRVARASSHLLLLTQKVLRGLQNILCRLGSKLENSPSDLRKARKAGACEPHLGIRSSQQRSTRVALAQAAGRHASTALRTWRQCARHAPVVRLLNEVAVRREDKLARRQWGRWLRGGRRRVPRPGCGVCEHTSGGALHHPRTPARSTGGARRGGGGSERGGRVGSGAFGSLGLGGGDERGSRGNVAADVGLLQQPILVDIMEVLPRAASVRRSAVRQHPDSRARACLHAVQCSYTASSLSPRRICPFCPAA